MTILLPKAARSTRTPLPGRLILSGTVRYIMTGAAPAKRFRGDGGPADQACLNFPTAVVVDRQGIFTLRTP